MKIPAPAIGIAQSTAVVDSGRIRCPNFKSRVSIGGTSTAALCGRRVEVDIKSRDLAVPCDDEIHTSVFGRFAFRPRAPRQPPRIVQNLGRAMRRVNKVGMCRSEIAGEL